MMTTIIDSLRPGVPAVIEELAQLGRTLHRRRTAVLAFFDRHASNGPTEAIKGRLEALRRNALGFPQPRPLPLALAIAQPSPALSRKCTLNYEEPVLSDSPVCGVSALPGMSMLRTFATWPPIP